VALGSYLWASGGVPAKEVALLADFDITIALGTNFLDPLRLLDWHTRIFLCNCPRPCQRVVDRRDLVIEDVRIGLIGLNPLPENALIVGV
jgi:hypothetical protein